MAWRDFTQPDLGAYVRYCVGFGIRYAAIAGGLVVLLHVLLPRAVQRFRIQPAFPDRRALAHEVLWSASNTLCTGLSTLLLWALIRDGHTRMYFDVAERGPVWFACSVVLGIAGYDVWFYGQHRLLHTRWLYRHVHRVHHRITNPTPLATFAHHPVETFMGNVYFLLLPLVLPIHPLAFAAVGAFFFGFGILAHLGYEFFPAGFTRHPLFGWCNTATHHNLHHDHVVTNLSLCFNGWDRWLGTIDRDYDATFDRVTARRQTGGA